MSSLFFRLASATAALCLSASVWADPVTVNVNLASGKCYRASGTTYTESSAGNYVSKWESSATITVDGTEKPALTLLGQGAYTNNFRFSTTNANYIDFDQGAATSYRYTLTAATGYIIKSVTITGVVKTQTNPTSVKLGDNDAVAMTAALKTLSVSDYKRSSIDLALSSTNNNGGFQARSFQVVLEQKTEPDYELSTEDNVKYYYILGNGSDATYAYGKAMYYDADANLMKFGTKTFAANYLWSLWQNPDGDGIELRAYNGTVMGTPADGQGGNTQFGKATTEHNYAYTIAQPYTGQYTLTAGSGAALHAQNAGSVLVRWPAAANNASMWTFEAVDVSNVGARVGATTVQQGKVTTGRGNLNDPILRSTISITGLMGSMTLSQVKGKITATNLSDIKAVKAYMATNNRELWVGASNKGENAKDMTWRESNVKAYLGQATVDANGNYTVDFEPQTLNLGDHYLWITFDIAEDAAEGNTVDATISQYTIDNTTVTEANGNPAYAATIFLSEGSVLMPADKGSTYYRIPAITATKDGKRLVTLTDDRLQHNSDLPNHCYIVAQYSDDNGKTWTNPKRVAGEAATGGDYGHGDAQIILNRNNGEIIGIMTSAPFGKGFFGETTPEQPNYWKVMKSVDNGVTWSVPENRTHYLFGANANPPENALPGAKVITNSGAAFSGSGAGLQMRDGTLVSPFSIREKENSDSYNAIRYYNVMSKDGGDTWFIHGTPAPNTADEPKVLERDNGDLAVSIRASGYNYHNVTSDYGMTWNMPTDTKFTTGFNGNACDGDYLVWCSRLEGNPWTIVAQTMPNSSNRQNVGIALSLDQGTTFNAPKTVCPRGSAYSSVTVMADGTMGMYYEENGVSGGYTMRFVRFSLDWASDKKYQFTEANPYRPIQPLTTELKDNAEEVKSVLESFKDVPADTEITLTTANITSPNTESQEGSIAEMLDGKANTYWHSTWSNGNVADGLHYFQVEVPADVADDALLKFWFKRRAVIYDHITEWSVVGTDNPNASLADCTTLAASIVTPFKTNTDEILSEAFPRNGFKYIRFVEKKTTTGRGYFHIAEFRLKSTTEDAVLLDQINNVLNSVSQSGNYAVTNEVKEQVINLLPTLNLSETEATDLPANKRTNVNVQRALNAEGWNTLCLPFDMSEAELKATFGEEAVVMEYTTCSEDMILSFTKAQQIVAGKPYFLKLTTPVTNFNLRNVEIKNTEEPVEYNSIAFKGTFSPISLTQDKNQFYFNQEGQLRKPVATGANLKGMRAYIQAPDAESGARLMVNFDGVATAIENINAETLSPEAIYNLQGQRVNQGALSRGLYIQNGRKFIVK